MPIGPALPPHLAHLSQRRSPSPDQRAEAGPSTTKAASTKETEEEEEEDDPYGPSLPPHLLAARRNRNNNANTNATASSSSPSPPRIIGRSGPSVGPSRPTAGPSTRQLDSPSPPRISRPTPSRQAQHNRVPDDSDDDDEVGPSLALLSGAPQKSAAEEFREREERIARAKEGKVAQGDEGPKREEWMLLPPTSGPLAQVDPLRKRPTTFSRRTEGPQEADSSWTETPEERRQRVKDEMAGVRRPSATAASSSSGTAQKGADQFGTKRRKDEEIREEVERYSKTSRGQSLLDKHAAKRASGSDKDSEPVAIWDHARDMGITGRLMSDKERQAKIKDARGLNDRFGHSSSGAYQI